MRRSVSLVLALVLAASVATSQRTPSSFWKESIKEPLSKADADLVFMEHYKDAGLPPPQVPFLEGTVVDVVPTPLGAQLVRLDMEKDGTADAGILFDGRAWTLAGEPEKGATVRFVGVARAFEQHPFFLTFQPESIVSGLAFSTTESNVPFGR